MTTSNADEWAEKFLASCEYEASEAAGCGTTLTWIPVSVWNRFASARSRLWLPPTALSPTNVIFCPWYFALIFFAFATGGALIAFAAVGRCVARFPAAATLSEATRATTPVSPTKTSTTRCFTIPTFLSAQRRVFPRSPSLYPYEVHASSGGLETYDLCCWWSSDKRLLSRAFRRGSLSARAERVPASPRGGPSGARRPSYAA